MQTQNNMNGFYTLMTEKGSSYDRIRTGVYHFFMLRHAFQ